MLSDAVKLSLKIAGTSMVISVGIAFMLAIFLHRGERRREKIMEAVISFPLFFPPSVLGYLLLTAVGRKRWLGSWLGDLGIQIVFTWRAGVVAGVIVSLPMAYQCIKAGFLSIEREYIEAAYEMGANRWERCRYVILPLIRKNIGAAGVLSFGRAFGEFGATLMIAGNIPGRTQTIPMAIYSSVERGDYGTANKLLLIVVAVTVTVMWGYNHYLGGRREGSFAGRGSL